MQLNNTSNKAIASEVKDAAAKIKPTVFYFNHGDAAYKFHVGIAVKFLLIGSLILLFTVAGIWYWSLVNNVDQAKTILQTPGNISHRLGLQTLLANELVQAPKETLGALVFSGEFGSNKSNRLLFHQQSL